MSASPSSNATRSSTRRRRKLRPHHGAGRRPVRRADCDPELRRPEPRLLQVAPRPRRDERQPRPGPIRRRPRSLDPRRLQARLPCQRAVAHGPRLRAWQALGGRPPAASNRRTTGPSPEVAGGHRDGPARPAPAALDAAQRAEMMSSAVDHRAMNSLQLIASMLRPAEPRRGFAATSQQLTAAANRVLAVARVHRAFSVPIHRPGADRRLSRKLCGELSGILGCADIAVEASGRACRKRTPRHRLGRDELVTNAKKHGDGQITVALRDVPTAA